VGFRNDSEALTNGLFFARVGWLLSRERPHRAK